MKYFLAAVGLAAAGVTALHGQSENLTTQPNPNAELTPQEQHKFWSVSGAVRGFYDDNYTAIPKSLGPLSSWGIEVSPSVSVNWNPGETLVGASYVYDYKWYEKLSQHDQTHQFNGKLVHNFSPRYRLELNDSFVRSSEPTVLDTTIITSPDKRTLEDNSRNRGAILFAAELTPILGAEVGYQNSFYDYRENLSDTTPSFAGPFDFTLVQGPSRSALLDRIEHLITLDLRWKLLPETTAILGYQFEVRDFTSNESINPTPFPPGTVDPAFPFVPSKIRDSRSHFFFVGVDQSMGPNLRASVRAGGQYVDYYHEGSTQLSPYADASVTYTYLPGSYVQVGVKHEHAATDIVGSSFDPVKDQEATTVYGAWTHHITAKLTGSVLAQFQNSVFNGGGPGVDGESENFFLANLNLAYKINPYLLTEAGYEYNDLNSHFDRGYVRNRAYIGVRATY